MRFIVSLNLIGLVLVFTACGWQKGAGKGSPATTASNSPLPSNQPATSWNEWAKFEGVEICAKYASQHDLVYNIDFRNAILSDRNALVITMNMKNTDATKNYQIKPLRLHAVLKDNLGNEIPQMVLKHNGRVYSHNDQMNDTRSLRFVESVKERDAMREAISFELPPPGAKDLILEINTEAFGSTLPTTLVFTIPESEWKPKPKQKEEPKKQEPPPKKGLPFTTAPKK